MAPINISIEGVGGVRLSSDSALDKWLDKNKVQCLINKDGYQVVDFDSLENEGVYKLGPPLLQQQQVSQRFFTLSEIRGINDETEILAFSKF